jgi:hypothetical protein
MCGDWMIVSALDFGPDSKRFEVVGKEVKHSFAGDKSSGSEGNLKFITCAIIISAFLLWT